jgi:nucleotide-binding universal stress UspA family protein
MKILLAVDGSKFSKKMLAYITTHESLFSQGHDYMLLNVQPTLPGYARSNVGKDVVTKYYQEEGEAVLGPATKFLMRHNINAKTQMKTGHVAETIAKVAEQGDFDLVVMGTHGHGALMKLVMGSVATQVLAHCKTPVLLVR